MVGPGGDAPPLQARRLNGGAGRMAQSGAAPFMDVEGT
jgi:hypothetical protein